MDNPTAEAVELRRLGDMAEANRIIELDFPVRPEVRYGWGKPPHPELQKLISTDDSRYAATIKHFGKYKTHLQKIAAQSSDPHEPSWVNDMLPAADAISIYGYLALRNPRHLIEIGSGNSTKFARRAIKDHKLRTKIISIDPHPRAECDDICDTVIREPLERADLSLFSSLTKDDVIFCDNSHRSFQNSDVTVFFLDILPRLPRGMLVGIHDIFLPLDYQPAWNKRFYNEQYLLACWLLAGKTLRVELPVLYAIKHASIGKHFDPIWSHQTFDTALKTGGAFWVTKR